jgi:branched-chain amino acid transport system permease protein
LRLARGKRIDQPVRAPVPIAAPLILRIIVFTLLAFCLASCGTEFDRLEVTTCRQTLPAVELDADEILVTRVSTAPPPYSMRIDYRVTRNGMTNPSYVLCGFAPSDADANTPELRILSTPVTSFSPIKLHILKRFWLERHELSYPADPGPGETEADVPEVPAAAAYLVQSAINGVPETAMTMLIAVAYALVYGLVGRINLAFGDLAAVGGVVSVAAALAALALGSSSFILPLVVGALAAIGLTMLAGRIVERLVFAPLAFRGGQSILIATIGVAVMMRELMRLAEGPQNRWIPPIDAVPIPLLRAGSFVVNITPMQIGVGIVVVVAALLVVRLMQVSQFGRQWRAISDDAVMAALMGISRYGVLTRTFLLASALAGAAGFILTATYGATDAYSGVSIGLKGLVAAVIGGIGSVEGALLGGLALGLFETIWQAYLPVGDRDVAVMVVMVVMLIFRPGGLFGFAESGPRQV